MKKLLATIGLACLTWSVNGQGVIAFNTIGGGVNAPVTNQATGLKVTGNTFLAQLFYGQGMVTDQFALIEVPGTPAMFGTGATAGYVTTTTGGGNRVLPIAPGSQVTVQMRAWDIVLGQTWDQAFANWNASGRGPGIGFSRLGIITALGSATSASLLTSLNPGFFAPPVPEPSVIALGILGGIGVLLLRRRK